MRRLIASVFGIVVAAAVAVGVSVGGALAQSSGPVNQMRLTEALVKGFIAAQKDLAPLADELQKAAESGAITPGLQGKLDAVAKKNGFQSLTELDDVTENINLIMSGIDPQTGEFQISAEDIRKEIEDEIEEIKKDTTIPEAEKKEVIEEREAAMKTAGEIKHPENIALVKKYRTQIEEAMQQ